MADTSELLPSTDDAPVVDVLTAVAQCAAAWEPGARLLGNVRACDILRAVTHAKSRLQAEDPEGGLEDVIWDACEPFELEAAQVRELIAAITRALQSRTSQAEAQAPAVTREQVRQLISKHLTIVDRDPAHPESYSKLAGVEQFIHALLPTTAPAPVDALTEEDCMVFATVLGHLQRNPAWRGEYEYMDALYDRLATTQEKRV